MNQLRNQINGRLVTLGYCGNIFSPDIYYGSQRSPLKDVDSDMFQAACLLSSRFDVTKPMREEILAKDIEIRNSKAWDATMYGVVDGLLKEHSLEIEFKPVLRGLTLIGPNAGACDHKLSKNVPQEFATVVVDLQNEYSGGEFRLRNDAGTVGTTVATSVVTKSSNSFICWLRGTKVIVEPITAGFRALLLYDILPYPTDIPFTIVRSLHLSSSVPPAHLLPTVRALLQLLGPGDTTPVPVATRQLCYYVAYSYWKRTLVRRLTGALEEREALRNAWEEGSLLVGSLGGERGVRRVLGDHNARILLVNVQSLGQKLTLLPGDA